MDNEKLFSFMEKMYSEMQHGFKGVNDRLDKVENRMTILENEVKETKTILYDGYIQNAEAINRVETKVEYIAEKVSKNEMEVKVLQSIQSKPYRG